MDDRAIAAAAALEERKVAMRCDGVRRGSRRVVAVSRLLGREGGFSGFCAMRCLHLACV
jgi:hypothetical protein